MMDTTILKKLIVTEKTSKVFADEKADKVYAFRVSKAADKKQIKDLIENIYEVKVKSVNTLTMKGKEKMFRRHKGKRSDFKKAYVTLKAGCEINIEESV